MPSIEVVSEYSNVRKLAPHASFAKNWTVKPKPEPLGIEQRVRGHVIVKKGMSYLTDKTCTTTYDRADEMLKGIQQETDRQLSAYRYPDQQDFTNVQRQQTGGMWSSEMVRRIRKLNNQLITQDSKNAPGCAAFYKFVDGKLIYTNASFRHGFVPKYTVMRTDTADLVTEFDYGWTTVLLRLIKSKDLTYKQVTREFGYVEDDRAKHWAAHTKEFRI